MVALNIAMLSLMALLFGVVSPNDIIQVYQENNNGKLPGYGGYGSGCPCDCPHEVSCDPCCKDPPEVCTDPLRGIPSDDPSLTILVQLSWPRNDVTFLIEAFQAIALAEKSESAGKRIINNLTELTAAVLEEVESFSEEAELNSITAFLEAEDFSVKIRDSLKAGEDELAQKDAIEIGIRDANITFDANSPSLKHQLAFGRTDNISTTNARLGTIMGGASLEVVKGLRFSKFSTVGLQLIPAITDCEQRHEALLKINNVQCPDINNLYRTLDGSCNNIGSWLWGKAFTPYRRDLSADYDDGISTFRKAVSGDELPSARLISTAVNTIHSEKSKSYSILHMTFGQLVDHDIIATPLARASGYGGSSAVKCCDLPISIASVTSDVQLSQKLSILFPFKPFFHPACAPISIPSDDPFYKCHDQRCMEFVRSAPAGFCRLGPRQQINQHSAYLDGSVIYGVKTSGLPDLRTFVNGLLKGQVVQEDQMLLPRSLNAGAGCNTAANMANDEYCFKAGDGRVNEQILLTFFHTLWTREHNRIARILKGSNPVWVDEKLFQETRRIIGAEFQQVTYNEYVPTVIGPTLMAASNLNPLKGNQQTTDYDSGIDAGIANAFSTAAYRFGHSQIADNVLYVSKHGEVHPKELSTLYFNPYHLYKKNGMCDLARGGTSLPQDKMDPYFSLEVAGKLFRGPHPFGLDLLAINTQRGRDHGMAPYNSWRKFCGLPVAQDFDDLLPQMTEDRVEALKLAYQNVNDIDLYIGGVSETPIPGAVVGHTFSCIIHNQFLRIKRGDRYWFEYKDGPGAFTPAQIKQLHRVTLARIMCNNMPELEYIQRWPLRNPGPDNPKVCCKSIRQYDLDPWEENYMGKKEKEAHEDDDDC